MLEWYMYVSDTIGDLRTVRHTQGTQLHEVCVEPTQHTIMHTQRPLKQSFALFRIAIQASRLGTLVDWSEQQVYELEAVAGKETVEKVIKGCQVHFTRSVK